MLALLLLLSQKQDSSTNESYNLIKMCKCVGIFVFFVCGGWMNSSAWSISLLYFPWMWTIFLFFFFSFWHALWACGIPSLGMHLSFFYLFFSNMPFEHVAYLLWVCIFYFLLHSPHPWWSLLERKSHGMSWSFFLWVDDSVCYVRERVRDLDHDSMTSL